MPMKMTDKTAPCVHLRRMYVDCRYGQMHLRSAFASNGGFDELTTLVCLHPDTMTSRVFEEFLRLMGSDRSAYAPDTPGLGASDPPPSKAGVADLAAAIGDVLDHLRLRRVDLLGYHAGAGIAAELAVARPEQVRRVVMVAPPERLPRVTQSVLVLSPQDDVFDVAPEVVAKHVRAFLDD